MAPNARDFSSAGPGPAASPSQEYALLDFAERLDRHRAGRIAVHIHLSRLQSHNRREHHLRVAVSTFEDLVKQFQGHIFELANQDIVFLCMGRTEERRVGKECVSTFGSRWWQVHKKKK